MNPFDFFAAAAAATPTRIALRDARSSLTYAEVLAACDDVARALHPVRQPRELKVAVYSPNCVQAMVAMLGLFRAGAVWVPLNVRNSLPDNIEVLRRSDVDVLLVHGDFAGHVQAMQAGAPTVRRVLCIDRRVPGLLTVAEAAATRPREQLPARRPDSSRTCAMLSTGGTTGLPKGVLWPESVVEAMVASFWVHLPCDEPPVYLAAAPLTHAAGVIGLCLLARGATVVILAGAAPLEVMQAIERHRVTHLFLPPTVIYMMLAHPGVRTHDYASLRYFIYTAAPMAPDKVREAIDVFGPVMIQLYGQAEVPLMGTVLTPADHERFLREGRPQMLASCGRPTLLAQVEVMADDGLLVPSGELGEIVFRGPLVMRGYHGAPEETAAASRFGWHHTGDVGFKDEAGYLHIVDRKRDMIITGGFNVYSREVEQVVLAWPGVQDCAVIGLPDAKWGEVVTAFVEAVPGAEVDVAALQAHCRDRLGGVKAPKALHVVDALPRSAVGKLLKRELRERYWAGRERRV